MMPGAGKFRFDYELMRKEPTAMKVTTNNHFANRLAKGAAGGLVGACVLQGLRMASKRMLPSTLPPMRQDPDEYLVLKAERQLPSSVAMAIPPIAETAAVGLLAAGYGVLWGAIAGAIGCRRVFSGVRGSLLGVATWAVSYLGWLPLSGLMPPLRRQRRAQIAGPLVRHLAFGLVAVCVSDWLQGKSKTKSK
jgi:hypothetical protein